jgi:phosphoglycolate phosphatase-like HAD superfamily hydrolase
MRVIVFSDIDGTMTSPDFPWEATLDTLRACEAYGIGIVAVTSKTLDEMAVWRHLPAFLPCFAYESGWGIAVPSDEPYGPAWGAFVRRWGYRFVGESDGLTLYEWPQRPDPEDLRRAVEATGVRIRLLPEIPPATLACWSGLSSEAVQRAYRRRGPLPFVIEAGSWRTLAAWARTRGWYLLRGKLLTTLTPVHKGHAVGALYPGLRRTWPRAAFWAVGDTASDRRMARRGVPFVGVDHPRTWRRWMQRLFRSKPWDDVSSS